MAQSELCTCLHGKTNHRTTHKKNQIAKNKHHECLVNDCICEKYEYFKNVASNRVNYIDIFGNVQNLI